MDKPRVLLSLPHMGSSHVANSAAVETMMLTDNRVELHVIRNSAIPTSSNMNKVVKNFLEGSWDYWINLDNDQAPLKNPLDLVFLDKDVIGLPTPVFKIGQPETTYPFYWNVYAWNEEGQNFLPFQVKKESGALQEVDAVGSGCWVVARRVLEAVKQPLNVRFDEDGITKMGGDMSFCMKAKDAGFKIYAHYEYPCRHFKTVDLYEIMVLLARAKDGNL